MIVPVTDFGEPEVKPAKSAVATLESSPVVPSVPVACVYVPVVPT